MKKSFLCVFFLLLYSSVFAQWPDSPDLNLPIGVLQGDMVQPKSVVTPNGDVYVSWFGQRGRGYNVYMQKMDSEGTILWQQNGIIVAQRSFESTQDYGLSLHVDGSALIAYRIPIGNSEGIAVQKVSPDGELLWGSQGVVFTDGSDFVAAPNVAGLNDGNTVVAWTENSYVALVNVNESGEINWTRTITGQTGLALSDIRASDGYDETGVFNILVQSFGLPTVPRQLFAQKIDANGQNIWSGNLLQIFNNGSLQFGNFPDFISDGFGGMIIPWYQSTPSLQAYVQHITKDGERRFQLGGLPLSTGGQLRTDPVVSYNQDNDEIFAFWRETNSTQVQIGLYAQKVLADGTRAWGDAGLELIPLSGTDIINIESGIVEADPVVYFTRNVAGIQSQLSAARLNSAGEFVWDTDFISVSTVSSSKSSLFVASDNENNQLIAVWSDSRNGTNDIFGQNVLADGNLGPMDPETSIPIYNDRPQNVVLYQNYPNPFNPSTNIRFDLMETGNVIIEVYDVTGRKISTLQNGSLPAGSHILQWNATGLSGGLYILTLKTLGTSKSIPMMLVK